MNRLCECGCGKEVTNEINRFIFGHANRGKTFMIDEKTRQKMSESHTGNRHSAETKQKMINNHSRPHLGKTLSSDTISKMSKSHTGKYHSNETRLKMSINNGMKGKKHTFETRIKMSLGTIKYLENNHYGPRRGRNENQIINQLQKETKINLLQNDFSIAHKISKFADAYSPKYNLVIEIKFVRKSIPPV